MNVAGKMKIHQALTTLLLVGSLLLAPGLRAGESAYLSLSEFLALAFPGEPIKGDGVSPPIQRETLWLDADLKAEAKKILGHSYAKLRVRYWRLNDRTAWVLDEIGKDRPITMGVVVDNDQIADLQVLVFRESRGWEIRHDFFTRQFLGLSLRGQESDSYQLSGDIDGITGATLSVRAAKKVAKLALFFDQQVATLISANAD
ncbi:hypothetical protein NBRC116494_09120 [Aurantivibrio plasticivorans]